jgi:RimJ/RimL family protein N-acetyltransferase
MNWTEDQISLRLVQEADCELLFLWRNDNETRLNSFSSDEIQLDQHKEWLAEILNDSQHTIYLAVEEMFDLPVGVVFFEKQAETGEVEVSINLDPEKRAQGLGSLVLARALAEYSENDTVVFRARIKNKNVRSQKVFLKCGFAKYSESENFAIFKNKLFIIDKIQMIRSKNNVNWMDLMRLAFRTSPHEAEEIFSRINIDDDKIANLLKRLIQK